MKLYIVRHGETDWNRQGVFRGRQDVPLNGRGVEQALRLGSHLAGKGIAVVKSSPLSRAQATAAAIARAVGVQVETDDRLIDIHYGAWEGRSRGEILRSDALRYRQWKKEPDRTTFPEGESLAYVRDRAMPAIQDLCDSGKDAAVVTHRVVCKVIICSLLGLGLEAFWRVHIDTAAYTVFAFDGIERRLTAHNIRPYPSKEDEQDF